MRTEAIYYKHVKNVEEKHINLITGPPIVQFHWPDETRRKKIQIGINLRNHKNLGCEFLLKLCVSQSPRRFSTFVDILPMYSNRQQIYVSS